MRALLVLLSSLVLLSACSKEVKLVSASASQEPLRVEEQATVDMRLTKNDLSKYVDMEAGIWQEARNAGLIKLFNKILNKNLLIVPVSGRTSMGTVQGEYSQSGVLTAQPDEETGDVVQSFLLSASFEGDTSQGGQIIALEEDHYVAGMTDVTYAMLYQSVPESLPSYVVIAEPVPEIGTGFLRVIGMAEIVQLKDDTVMLPKEQGGATGTLCTLQIIASDREVEAGDSIFLMSVDVSALESDTAMTPEGEPETVVVLPPSSDKVQEPKEKK